MPGMDGLELLRRVREAQPEVEVVVITAHGKVDSAVEAMRLGAFDYLQKPLGSLAELRLLVRRAAERRALRSFREVVHVGRDEPELSHGAAVMRPVIDALRKVAATDATVLLVGESGTGKEVAARAVHRWSRREAGPFVAVNCAALSESLLESELFGHERGAFTGAATRRRGRIELAQGGTFFLDEVGELAPGLSGWKPSRTSAISACRFGNCAIHRACVSPWPGSVMAASTGWSGGASSLKPAGPSGGIVSSQWSE